MPDSTEEVPQPLEGPHRKGSLPKPELLAERRRRQRFDLVDPIDERPSGTFRIPRI